MNQVIAKPNFTDSFIITSIQSLRGVIQLAQA